MKPWFKTTPTAVTVDLRGKVKAVTVPDVDDEADELADDEGGDDK